MGCGLGGLFLAFIRTNPQPIHLSTIPKIPGGRANNLLTISLTQFAGMPEPSTCFVPFLMTQGHMKSYAGCAFLLGLSVVIHGEGIGFRLPEYILTPHHLRATAALHESGLFGAEARHLDQVCLLAAEGSTRN